MTLSLSSWLKRAPTCSEYSNRRLEKTEIAKPRCAALTGVPQASRFHSSDWFSRALIRACMKRMRVESFQPSFSLYKPPGKKMSIMWRLPGKQPKRGRLWLNDGSCIRLRAERADQVWSYDFVHHRTHDGRAFRMLNVLDEFARESLAIRVRRKLNSTRLSPNAMGYLLHGLDDDDGLANGSGSLEPLPVHPP